MLHADPERRKAYMKAYMEEYRKRPEAEIRRRAASAARWQRIKNDPEQLEKKRAENREYWHDEGVQARFAERKKATKWKERQAEYNAEYRKLTRTTDDYKFKRWAGYLWKEYGITPDDYFSLLKAQGGSCVICGRGDVVFHVDHDHVTGKIRGLLCLACNMYVGRLEKCKDRLQRALRYLNESGKEPLCGPFGEEAAAP